jgi:G-patch domain
MMEKMGWATGVGLGKEKNGMLEPVAHVVKTSKSGLGGSMEKITIVEPESTSSEAIPLSVSSSKGILLPAPAVRLEKN